MENIFLTSLTSEEVRKLIREELEKFFFEYSLVKGEGPKEPATRKEAADYLKISLPTLDALVRTGQIETFKIGRQTRITWDSLELFSKSNIKTKL